MYPSLLGTLNASLIAAFGTAATYTPSDASSGIGSAAAPILGIVLRDKQAMPEMSAPGYYCDLFVCVGSVSGTDLPWPPVRGDSVTLDGEVYYVGNVEADKVGNGYRLALQQEFGS